MASALAPGSVSQLRTALRHFARFLAAHGRTPAFRRADGSAQSQAATYNETTIMLFATVLARERSVTASTILGYCSAVRNHAATVFGFTTSTNTPRWKRFTKAIKKRFAKERAKCRALRARHLRIASPAAEPGPTRRSASNCWPTARPRSRRAAQFWRDLLSCNASSAATSPSIQTPSTRCSCSNL
jgi:hypothetical protein